MARVQAEAQDFVGAASVPSSMFRPFRRAIPHAEWLNKWPKLRAHLCLTRPLGLVPTHMDFLAPLWGQFQKG